MSARRAPGAARGGRVRRLAWLALLIAGSLTARRAAASSEEFSTFSVIAQEEDDESAIDHLLTAPPAGWRSDWEHATNALRTSQGCLTSGQWFIDTHLKLETSLGERARFGFDYTDHQADDATYTNTDLLFRWPVAYGHIGAMFRPFHDKSRQDFGLGWGFGADTTAVKLEATWVFEDLFNNLWAWRQSRVGGTSEPYTRHPWEPNLALTVRRDHARFELNSRYRSPSIQHVDVVPPDGLVRSERLWGALIDGALEFDALGTRWRLTGYDKQARGMQDQQSTDGNVGIDFRRQWWASGGGDRRVRGGTFVTWRWTYMERGESYSPPLGSGRFHAIDRIQQLELRGQLRPTVEYRVGWMHDHINVHKDPGVPGFSFGTRGENRLYLGLDLRLSRVRTTGVEGVELDREPYDVAHHHDKGFLSLQSSF